MARLPFSGRRICWSGAEGGAWRTLYQSLRRRARLPCPIITMESGVLVVAGCEAGASSIISSSRSSGHQPPATQCHALIDARAPPPTPDSAGPGYSWSDEEEAGGMLGFSADEVDELLCQARRGKRAGSVAACPRAWRLCGGGCCARGWQGGVCGLTCRDEVMALDASAAPSSLCPALLSALPLAAPLTAGHQALGR